jgi:hypothetical protein
VDKSFSGTVPLCLFLADFQPVLRQRKNLANPLDPTETQQGLNDAIKVVGFTGRWLFFLGLSTLSVIWVASWGWSTASMPMASQTPLSVLELIGKTIATLLVSGVLLGLGVQSARETLCRLGHLRPAPRHSHSVLATVPGEAVGAPAYLTHQVHSRWRHKRIGYRSHRHLRRPLRGVYIAVDRSFSGTLLQWQFVEYSSP